MLLLHGEISRQPQLFSAHGDYSVAETPLYSIYSNMSPRPCPSSPSSHGDMVRPVPFTVSCVRKCIRKTFGSSDKSARTGEDLKQINPN